MNNCCHVGFKNDIRSSRDLLIPCIINSHGTKLPKIQAYQIQCKAKSAGLKHRYLLTYPNAKELFQIPTTMALVALFMAVESSFLEYTTK